MIMFMKVFCHVILISNWMLLISTSCLGAIEEQIGLKGKPRDKCGISAGNGPANCGEASSLIG